MSRCAETCRPRGTCPGFSLFKNRFSTRVRVVRGSRLNRDPALARCAITTAHPAWDTCTRFLLRRYTLLSRLRIADLLTESPINRNFKCGIRSKEHDRSLGVSRNDAIRSWFDFGQDFSFFFSLIETHACRRITYVKNFSEISRVECPLDTNITTVFIIIS